MLEPGSSHSGAWFCPRKSWIALVSRGCSLRTSTLMSIIGPLEIGDPARPTLGPKRGCTRTSRTTSRRWYSSYYLVAISLRVGSFKLYWRSKLFSRRNKAPPENWMFQGRGMFKRGWWEPFWLLPSTPSIVERVTQNSKPPATLTLFSFGTSCVLQNMHRIFVDHHMGYQVAVVPVVKFRAQRAAIHRNVLAF